MNPVFGDFIDFLDENNCPIKLEEGFYWMDRMIIRGFDSKGNEHKVLRVFVDSNFNITFKVYDRPYVDFISWKNLAHKHKKTIDKKVNSSQRVITELLSKYKDSNIYICHSGGKDSEVLLHMVRGVNPEIPILFNNTSNESAGTYKFIKSHNNVKILNPKEGFWQYLKRQNFIPSRFARSCCNIYKHDLTLDNLPQDESHLLFMGMRNAESNNRKNYKNEHFFDYYPEHWVAGLPIRKWTELDIWLYLILNDIRINDVYKMGYSRCGCIICPYRNNLEELITRYNFPHQIKRFNEIQESNFTQHERWIGLNCTLDEFKNKGAWKGGQYREEPTNDVIMEFANYKGISFDVAKQYFNKQCFECGRKIRQKDVIAMNLKYHGRGVDKFFCKKHLSEKLDMNHSEWVENVERFKSLECDLF